MRLRALITVYLTISSFFLHAQFPSEKELAKHGIKKIVVWEYQCRHEPSEFVFTNPGKDTMLDSCINETQIIDKKGKKTERFARGNAGDTTMLIHRVFLYSREGYLLQEKDLWNFEGRQETSHTQDYILDRKGNISKKIQCNFSPGGKSHCDTSFYEYNKLGQLIKIRHSKPDNSTYFTYDKKGRLSSEFQLGLGDTVFKIVNSYDQRGRPVEQIESDSWGKRKYRIIYNTDGKPIEVWVKSVSDKEVLLDSYAYGADGLLRTHKIFSLLSKEIGTLNYYYERK